MPSTIDKLKRTLNQRPITSLVLGSALLGLCFAALPTYRYVKKARSESVLEESKALWEDAQYRQAFQKAHTASLLAPSSVEASRHLADIALKVGHPQAYKFWERVIYTDEVTTEDWQFATRASMMNRSPESTFEYLSQWKRSQDNLQEAYYLARIQALVSNDQHYEAKQEAKVAIGLYEESIPIYSLYFALVKEFGTEEEQKKALAIMLEWSKRDDELGIKTLRSLVVTQTFTNEQREEAANRLLSHPKRGETDTLKAIAALALINPDYLLELDEEVSELINLDDLESLRIYTSLLCETGRYEEVLELVDEEKAATDKRLYQNVLMAKIGVGATDEVLDQTSDNSAELFSMAEDAVLRALAFKDSGNDANYKFNIEESIDKATDQDIDFIQHQLVKLGERDLLLDLYLKLGDHPKFGARTKQLAIQLALGLKDEEKLLRSLRSVDLSNDFVSVKQKPLWIYLHLIFGEDMEVARRQAESIATTHAGVPFVRALLAYSYFLSGDSGTAQSLIAPGMTFNDIRCIVLCVAIFEGTDREKEFRAQLDKMDTSKLLKTELDLIAKN